MDDTENTDAAAGAVSANSNTNYNNTRLPFELLHLVALRTQSAADRARAARVCIAWSRAFLPVLYRHVQLRSPLQIRAFVHALLCAIMPPSTSGVDGSLVSSGSDTDSDSRSDIDPVATALAHALDLVRTSSVTDIEKLPRIELPSRPSSLLPANFLENTNNNNTGNADEGTTGNEAHVPPNAMAGFAQFMASFMNFARNAAAAASDEQKKENSSIQSTLSEILNGAPFTPDLSTRPLQYVRKLCLPTFDSQVNLVSLINELLPNLRSICFHHNHTLSTSDNAHHHALFTPISSRVLQTLQPTISSVTSLTIEDVHPSSWSVLLSILKGTAKGAQLLNLRILNLEAVATDDQFLHSVNFAPAFANLPNLTCLRLDGLLVGPDVSLASLGAWCPRLTVIALDFCPLLTMASFGILWNGNPNLTFLGMAGVVDSYEDFPFPDDDSENELDDQELNDNNGTPTDNTISSAPTAAQQAASAAAASTLGQNSLRRHENMRIVRLVDCDVSDVLFTEIAHAAPRLDMLRFVFEDDQCDGIISVVDRLTDDTLAAFTSAPASAGAPPVPLTRLAFTWCPGFSHSVFGALVDTRHVQVLDLHKDDGCTLGAIPQAVVEDCAAVGAFRRVRVLNLSCQAQLSDTSLAMLFTAQHCPKLESVCLNYTSITAATLRAMVGELQALSSISIIGCSQIDGESLKAMFNEGIMTRVMRMYTDHCWNAAGTSAGGSSSESVAFTPSCGASGSGIRRLSVDAADIHEGAGGGEAACASKTSLEEPACIIHDDSWFVDEGLDIMSLWNEGVQSSGIRLI
ncbi:hypothetical protein HDU84_006575 [Entophlyctis sp. JEL0112]|nr:hypothetical protein HDU84_006575 [Entophlyctis sp. JEL0112]